MMIVNVTMTTAVMMMMVMMIMMTTVMMMLMMTMMLMMMMTVMMTTFSHDLISAKSSPWSQKKAEANSLDGREPTSTAQTNTCTAVPVRNGTVLAG